MPKSANFNEDCIAKAVAAVMCEKKPNISKIAREFVRRIGGAEVIVVMFMGRTRNP